MSDGGESFREASEREHVAFMRQVLVTGYVLAAGAVAGLAYLVSVRHALSYALGATLGYLNFVLLEQGVSKALATAADPASRKGASGAAIARFVLRIGLYGLWLYVMIAGRYLDVFTTALGLSTFVFAIMLKGFVDAARELMPVRSRTRSETKRRP